MHRSRFAKLWLSVVFALAFPCGIVMANSAPVEDEGGTASEHGEIDYNKPPLNIEWPLLIFSAVLIGVGFLTLRGKVWEPLIAAFNARELQIKTAHAEAAMVGKQAEALMKEHAARMDVVYQQVKDIVASARSEAEAAKVKIIADAEAEAKKILAAAVADVETAKQDALANLTSSVERHVTLTARQLAGTSA